MNPSWHIFFGFFFCLFLFFAFPDTSLMNISLVFFSSVLIDVDHYLFYLFTTKNFSLRRAYAHFIEQKRKWKEFGKDPKYVQPIYLLIFHGLEVLVILFIFSFFFKPFYFVFIGFSFHLFLDLIEQAVYSNQHQKFSLVNDFLKYKK